MAARPVNNRQLDVLRWIVDGCPPREWPDTTYKTIAIALQNRRLATVSRRGGVWRAEATDAGRYYVQHGAYPSGHWSPPAPTPPSADRRKARSGPGSQAASSAPAPPSAQSTAISGEQAAPTPPDPQAQEAPDDVPAPIKVPARMSSRPHRAVRSIQTRPNALSILSKPLRPRALRILDALAKEAERRGYQVTEHDGRLRIAVRGHAETLDLREPTTRKRHVPTEAEIAAQKRDSWRRPPDWDVQPSGRLRAVVGHRDVAEPKPRKNGTVAWTMENRLNEVLGLVEDAAATAEHWQRRRQEKAEAKKRRWEEARANAVVRFHEQQRVGLLRDQMDRWEESARIAKFLEVLDGHIAGLDDADAARAATEWREWVSTYAARRAPFARPVRMPEETEPTPQDLAPFMPGMSPYAFY